MRRSHPRSQKLARPRPGAAWAAAAVLAGLTALFLWPVLFGGQVLLPASYLDHFRPWDRAGASGPPWNALIWDAMAQYYPWRAFAHRSLASGVIPLWNPHQFCGNPFLANSQSALFYPGNLLFWLLDPALAFGWSAALHILAAGLFMFLLVRRLGAGWAGALLSGIAFMFCGLFATWLEMTTVVCAAAWLPLVLLLVHEYFERRRWSWAVAGGAAMGLVILAGHPQMAFYVLFAAFCYGAWRGLSTPGPVLDRLLRTAAWAGLAGAVALCLSAAQLLPTVEFARHSHRVALPGLAGLRAYVKFALPWQHLVTLLLPDFFGNPAAGTYASVGNYAEYVAYAGVLPLVLAPLALGRGRIRGSLFFAILAAFALLIALGTPLNAILFFLVPGFRGTGGPARMLFLYMACVSVLGGLGLDALLKRQGGPAVKALLASAGGWVLAAVLLALGAWLAHPALSRLSGAQFAVYLAGNSTVLLCTAAVVSLSAVLLRREVIGSPALAAVLTALLAFDLFSFGKGYSPTAPRSSVYPPAAAIDYLESRRGSGRIMPLYETWPLNEFPRAIMPPNSAMVYGLDDVQGYDSIYLASYKSVLAEVVGHDPSPPANGNMLLVDSFAPALLDVLGVKYVLSPSPIAGMTPASAGDVVVNEREDSQGEAYFTDAFIPAATSAQAIEGLRRFARSPASGHPPTFIESAELEPVEGGEAAAASVRRPSPNRAVAMASCPARGYLVLCDSAYPGWRALVDGEPAPIRVANGAFRAAPLTPGRHEVTFEYRPTSFRLGLFVTLLALASMAACLSIAMRRRR